MVPLPLDFVSRHSQASTAGLLVVGPANLPRQCLLDPDVKIGLFVCLSVITGSPIKSLILGWLEKGSSWWFSYLADEVEVLLVQPHLQFLFICLLRWHCCFEDRFLQKRMGAQCQWSATNDIVLEQSGLHPRTDPCRYYIWLCSY